MIKLFTRNACPSCDNHARFILISSISLFLLILVSGLSAAKWQTFTNTNNVTDMVVTPQYVYTATWGGVVQYKRGTAKPIIGYMKTITSVDGLVSNDVRTLAYKPGTEDIWAGTSNDGITIIKPNGFQILDENTGLPSNKIKKILVHQDYIFVATELGISQFYYLPGVNFPLLLHQYNQANTQGGLVNNNVQDMAVSDNGYLYCATAAGVSFVHTDSLDIDSAWHKWTSDNSPLFYPSILSISVNADYVAMNSFLSVHRHSTDPFAADWQSWTTGTGGLKDSVFSVTMSPSNGIFVSYGLWNEDKMTLMYKASTGYGYIKPDGTIQTHGEIPEDLDPTWTMTTESIFRFIDNPLGLCVVTWGEGFYVYKYGEFQYENNCIGFQTISEIKTDHNNRIWFGSGWLGGTMTRRGTRGVSELDHGLWTNYRANKSPLTSGNILNIAIDNNNKKWFGSWDSAYEPYHWRPGVNVYDDQTNDWKWYTNLGIRQWNDATGWSGAISGSPRILNNTIADIHVDMLGNIHVSSSGEGVTVFDKDYNKIREYQVPPSMSLYQSITYIYNSGSRYFFGLNVDNRLVIWNDVSLPVSSGTHWIIPQPSDLSDCFVYGVATITNPFGEEENWIATSKGLFMWDGVNWFRYDTDIKRRKYSGGTWTNETLYYVDEERLFGSVRTTPTAIYKDPFNRLWIGSLENGFTMYNPFNERFTNYYKANSPLLSNYVTCLGYDPIAGNLLIGTPDGLNSLKIGIEIKTETSLNKVKAFPNPFTPEVDGIVSIVNLSSDSMPVGKNRCKIFNSAGELVIEIKENNFARFDWNGLNSKGKKCSSGIYFFVVSDSEGDTQRGKIALIRK
jgi:hypothetical protein